MYVNQKNMYALHPGQSASGRDDRAVHEGRQKTMTDLSITDRIYEAAIIPERWADVCEAISARVDSFSASVVTLDAHHTYRWISSPQVHDLMVNFSRSPLRFENVRPRLHLQMAPFSFLRDVDAMTIEDLEKDPIYNEFMRPVGLGWSMGDVIQEPSGHLIIFDIIRQTDRGPFQPGHVETMNALRPDLARAALMSSRLAFREAQSAALALSAVGLPAAVIGDAGGVITMNAEMEGLSPRIRTGTGDRLLFDDPATGIQVQEALAQMRSGGVPGVQSIAVPAGPDFPALVLHLLPVRRNARDVFSRSAAILIATPVGEVGPPDLRIICGLFDLTGSEARVAREIGTGLSIDETAVKLGLARETVRTYLKRIFQKTGTSRQTQLVRLLSGLGGAGRPE